MYPIQLSRGSNLVIAAIAIAAALSSCVSVPEPLRGEYPDSHPNQVHIGQVGTRVRWGGAIIATNPEATQTCFEVLGKSLEETTRPSALDESQGRFIACKNGFQDPELFKAGRELTIIGRLDRLETRDIGEYKYSYPVVEADIVYLWPERSDYTNRLYPNYYPYYWNSPYPYFWYPYPYYGGYRGHVHISGRKG